MQDVSSKFRGIGWRGWGQKWLGSVTQASMQRHDPGDSGVRPGAHGGAGRGAQNSPGGAGRGAQVCAPVRPCQPCPQQRGVCAPGGSSHFK